MRLSICSIIVARLISATHILRVAPILEQKEAVGHAVRAGYMYAGIADVAAPTKDSAYMKVIDRIFENIVGKKYYLTGGVGARHDGVRHSVITMSCQT